MLLTDQSGLYTADPRRHASATLVQNGRAGDPELERMAGGVGTALARGGMLTKLLAAKRAARSGASTVIASGREHRVVATRRRRSAPQRAAIAGRAQTVAGRLPKLAGESR